MLTRPLVAAHGAEEGSRQCAFIERAGTKKKLTPREQKKSKGGIAVALEPSIVSAVAVLRDTKDKAQVQKVLQKWAARGHFSSHVARALGNAAAMKLDVPADSSAMSSSMTMAASSAARSKEAADKIILDMSSFSSAPAPSSAPPPPPPPPSSQLPSPPVRTWGASRLPPTPRRRCLRPRRHRLRKATRSSRGASAAAFL